MEEFEDLVAPYRRELYAHCYRMLGSVQDAEDALQEALLAAWRGMSGFEGRGSLRAWLYRIATNVCLRQIQRRPPRLMSPDHGPPRTDLHDLGEPITDPVFLEPWVEADGDPEADYLRRETIELAFVAALQRLPGAQRAVLILREVLAFSAAETAEMLDTTVVSVNSALQRARRTLDERPPKPAEVDRELVGAFMRAFEDGDVAALAGLLAEDARFTMPPLPAWFDGREDVVRFLAERVFESRWRVFPLTVNGQPAFACYRREDRLRLGSLNVLTLHDGRVAEITAFLEPRLLARLGLPPER